VTGDPKVENNVSLWRVEEQEDGSFKLLLYNDEPFVAE